MKKIILAALPLMLSSAAFAQNSNIDINIKFVTDVLEDDVHCMYISMPLIEPLTGTKQVACSNENDFKYLGQTKPTHGEFTWVQIKNEVTGEFPVSGFMHFFAQHNGTTAAILKDNLDKVKIEKVDNNNYIFALKDLKGPQVQVFTDKNYQGDLFRFKEDVSDFGPFSLEMDSYIVPKGWRVRFYEGKNFTGGYYTRTRNDHRFDSKDFSPRVQSARILYKPE